MLKVFGCSCFPNLRPYNNPKFQFRSVECTFLSYDIKHKGFKCLDPQDCTYISKDVQFNENSFSFTKTKSITSRSFIPNPTPTSYSTLIPIHASILFIPSPSTSSITNTFIDQSSSNQSISDSTNTISHMTSFNNPISYAFRNVYSMRTKSKVEIFKPKVFMASKEPTSIQEAL